MERLRTAIQLSYAVIVFLLLTGCSSTTGKLPDAASGATNSPTASSTVAPISGVQFTPATTAAVPTTVPRVTPRANASDLQLAVVDSEGDISLISEDGSSKKKLIDGSVCPKPVQFLWSPTGDRLACLSQNFVEIDTGSRIRTLSRYEIVIADIEGRVLKRIESAGSQVWSPTGQQMAFSVLTSVTPTIAYTYHVADADGNVANDFLGTEGNLIWSPDGSTIAFNDDSGEVAIYDINAKETRRLGSSINRALAWVLGGKELLVATELDEEGVGLGSRYKANLLEPASGKLARLAELDNGNSFWVSPDGSQVVFPSWDARRTQGGAQLNILDLATRTVTSIIDSTISYPSDFIPSTHVTFSPDGSFVYWIDVKTSTDIYRARNDGTGTTMIAHLPGALGARFSPDFTKIAYSVPGNPPHFWVSNSDGSGAVDLGSRPGAMAWRPRSASMFSRSTILGEAQLTQGTDVSALLLPLTGTRFIAANYDQKPGDSFGQAKLWLIDLDGSAKELVEGSIPWDRTRPDSVVAISPDGGAVAYITIEGDEFLLNVMNVVSGEKRTLLTEALDKPLGPIIAWTEDGRLLFQKNGYLWQIAPDGSNARQLTSQSLLSRSGEGRTWGFPSRDGRHILYDYRSSSGEKTVRAGQPEPTAVTKTFSIESIHSGIGRILDGAPASAKLSSRIPMEMSWSPDGSKLLIVRAQPSRALALVVLEVQSGAETTAIEDLWNLGDVPFSFDWSPNGSSLVVSARRNNVGWGGLYLLDQDGGNKLKRIGDTGKEYSYPRWLPDGSGVLFFREGNLWVALLDSQDTSRDAGKNRLNRLRSGPWPNTLNPIPLPSPVESTGLAKPTYFVGKLNGFTFYDPGNFDHAAYSLAWSPKCVSTINGNNARYATESEWKDSRLDFTATYLPPGAKVNYASASACEDDIINIQKEYGDKYVLSVSRQAGLPYIDTVTSPERIESTMIGGRPAIILHPDRSKGRTTIYMRDGASLWNVHGFQLELGELIKVAEGLK